MAPHFANAPTLSANIRIWHDWNRDEPFNTGVDKGE
jgi:hypothetical protein